MAEVRLDAAVKGTFAPGLRAGIERPMNAEESQRQNIRLLATLAHR